MYRLTDEQMAYIAADIRNRGIEMPELADNLLDHICCIIEQELKEDGDFYSFYETTVKRFYKDQLWEIEEETMALIIFKNYYIMKKLMIISGLLSATTLCFGIIFKFMFWPGAAFLLLSGVVITSFLFLPLLFTIKIKEKDAARDKWLLGIGTLLGILVSVHILFKVMHWPGGNVLFVASMALMLLVFVPFYFFSGIRSQGGKTNTVIVTLLMIMGCAMFLMPFSSSRVKRMEGLASTRLLVQNAYILSQQKRLMDEMTAAQPGHLKSLTDSIYNLCGELKGIILKMDVGTAGIKPDFEKQETFISNTFTGPYFSEEQPARQQLSLLCDKAAVYNLRIKNEPGVQPIETALLCGMVKENKSFAALAFLSQVQAQVLQNQLAFKVKALALKN